MSSGQNAQAYLPCGDIMEFQEILKKMRIIDDKIVYELNTTIPTNSFAKDVNVSEKCENLYKQLKKSHYDRDSAIKTCIKQAHIKTEDLQRKHDANPDDSDLFRNLKNQQLNLRMLKSEVYVEEIVKDRSLKIFIERCRGAYKPPDLST